MQARGSRKERGRRARSARRVALREAKTAISRAGQQSGRQPPGAGGQRSDSSTIPFRCHAGSPSLLSGPGAEDQKAPGTDSFSLRTKSTMVVTPLDGMSPERRSLLAGVASLGMAPLSRHQSPPPTVEAARVAARNDADANSTTRAHLLSGHGLPAPLVGRPIALTRDRDHSAAGARGRSRRILSGLAHGVRPAG